MCDAYAVTYLALPVVAGVVRDIDGYLRRAMRLRGALGACLVDHPSGSSVRCTGRLDAAGEVGALVNAVVLLAASATPGGPVRADNVVVTASNGYHLLRPLGIGGLVLYIWLDRVVGNLAMAARYLDQIVAESAAE